MQRVERHIVKNDKAIDNLCFLSKNLYNLANYYIRQEFVENDNWLRYYMLDKTLQKTDAYRALPAASSQQILTLLDKNWLSFFRSIKDWKKNPSKYKGRPKLPKYKDKEKGRSIIVFTNQQIKLKDGYIRFPKKVNLKPIKTMVNDVRQVRIVPQANCHIIEVVYNKEIKHHDLVSETFLSIDLGVNNLATCANNIGLSPFVINGRIIKSMNQFYHKKKAILQAYIGIGISKRIRHLTFRRNNKIEDYLHKTSRFIVNYCIINRISVIVIGKNKNWKQSVNLGKANNQSFVGIPFDKLIKQIQYKAEEVGIRTEIIEEAYTSKCSFLDGEPIGKHEDYIGKRICRGLFESLNGALINADVNGSYNILKKAFPNAFADGMARCGLHPIIVSINGNNYK